MTIRGSMAGPLWIRQGMATLHQLESDGSLLITGPPAAVAAVRHLHRLDPVAAATRSRNPS